MNKIFLRKIFPYSFSDSVHHRYVLNLRLSRLLNSSEFYSEAMIKEAYNLSNYITELCKAEIDISDILNLSLAQLESIESLPLSFKGRKLNPCGMIFLSWILYNLRSMESIEKLALCHSSFSLFEKILKVSPWDTSSDYALLAFYNKFSNELQSNTQTMLVENTLSSFLDKSNTIQRNYTFQNEAQLKNSLEKFNSINSNDTLSTRIFRLFAIADFYPIVSCLISKQAVSTPLVTIILRAMTTHRMYDYDDHSFSLSENVDAIKQLRFYERKLILSYAPINSDADCLKFILTEHRKNDLYSQACLDMIISRIPDIDTFQFTSLFRTLLQSYGNDSLCQFSLKILSRYIPDLQQLSVPLTPFTPYGAVSYLQFFSVMENDPKKYSISTYFNLIQKPLPECVNDIDSIIDSNEFKEFVIRAHHEFDADIFRYGLAMLFMTLGIPFATSIIYPISKSYQRIVSLYYNLSNKASEFTHNEIECISLYLREHFNSSSHDDTVLRLKYIQEFHKTKILPSLDYLEKGIEALLGDCISNTFLQKSTVAKKIDFDKVFKPYIQDWINAYLNLTQKSKDILKVFVVIVEEAILNDGSLPNLLPATSFTEDSQMRSRISKHYLHVAKCLTDARIDLSIQQNFKDKIVQVPKEDSLQSILTRRIKYLEELIIEIGFYSDFKDNLFKTSEIIRHMETLKFDVLKRELSKQKSWIIDLCSLIKKKDNSLKMSSNAECLKVLYEFKQIIKNINRTQVQQQTQYVTLRIRTWDNNPLNNFNLGSTVHNCLQPNGCNFDRYIGRLMDPTTFANILDIWNDQTNSWDVACVNWLYFSQDSQNAYITSNQYDPSRVVETNTELYFRIMQEMSIYTDEMAKAMGIRYITPERYGLRDRDYRKFHEKNPWETCELTVDKIGGFFSVFNSRYNLSQYNSFLLFKDFQQA